MNPIRRFALVVLAVAVLAGTGGDARAMSFNCHAGSGNPYCVYGGKVTRLYINESGLILMYFEGAVDALLATNHGLACAQNQGAAKYQTTWGAADFIYSTLMTAKTSNQDISLQLRCAHGGTYLNIDRIWLE